MYKVQFFCFFILFKQYIHPFSVSEQAEIFYNYFASVSGFEHFKQLRFVLHTMAKIDLVTWVLMGSPRNITVSQTSLFNLIIPCVPIKPYSWTFSFQKSLFYLPNGRFLKMMKNYFHLTLKALFILKLSRPFLSCRKMA